MLMQVGESLYRLRNCTVPLEDLALILGCQRSGTTLLFMMLTSHPCIVGEDEKYSLNQFGRPRSPAYLTYPYIGDHFDGNLDVCDIAK